MTATFTSRLQRKPIGGLLCGVVLAACVGCQTFSLTDEDFQRQQRGETGDRETGAVVGVDLHVTVDGQVAEGDLVVTWWTMRGTHQGKWRGIQPTCKAMILTGVNIQRIRAGLILEHWGAANTLAPSAAAPPISAIRGGRIIPPVSTASARREPAIYRNEA